MYTCVSFVFVFFLCCFSLLCFILAYLFGGFFFFFAFLFSKEREKGGEVGWMRRWEGSGKRLGGEAITRIYCVKKNIFNKNRKVGVN